MKYSIELKTITRLCALTVFLLGCPPSGNTWTFTFGQVNEEIGVDVILADNGATLVAGRTNSTPLGANGFDMCIVHARAGSGVPNWYRIFGGVGDQGAAAIDQASDGGFILAGFTVQSGGMPDMYVVKTHANGVLDWWKAVGDDDAEQAVAVQATSDGGYIVAGYKQPDGEDSDVYLVKLLSNGMIDWDETYGGAEDDAAYAVRETSDGGFIVAGYLGVAGIPSHTNSYFVKTDDEGDVQWTRNYGSIGDDEARDIAEFPEGGYAVTGVSNSYSSFAEYDLEVLELNADGGLAWGENFGGEGYNAGASVAVTDDGGYVVSGHTYAEGHGGADVYLLKIDSMRRLTWSKTFGGAADDFGTGVSVADDGGYIICGLTESYGAGGLDMYVIKTDSRGRGSSGPTS